MAKRKKAKPKRKSQDEKLVSIIRRLTRKFAPGVIQEALGDEYERLSGYARDPEYMFWEKCQRASHNLASGMNKWAQQLLDELEEGEESETEGG